LNLLIPQYGYVASLACFYFIIIINIIVIIIIIFIRNRRYVSVTVLVPISFYDDQMKEGEMGRAFADREE
jgi:hypothetical protein